MRLRGGGTSVEKEEEGGGGRGRRGRGAGRREGVGEKLLAVGLSPGPQGKRRASVIFPSFSSSRKIFIVLLLIALCSRRYQSFDGCGKK